MNQRIVQLDFPYEELLAIGYHSSFNNDTQHPVIASMQILPLRTRYRGPAQIINDGEFCILLVKMGLSYLSATQDIVDEALFIFRPAMFHQQFKIKGNADRTLMYLFLYIIECCKQLHGMENKQEALRKLRDIAIQQSLPCPGEARFPLKDFFGAPKNAQEEETLKAYLQQLRQEVGDRLVDIVFKNFGVADKHWTMFGKRRFINRCFNP